MAVGEPEHAIRSGRIWLGSSKLGHTGPEHANQELDVCSILSESRFMVRFTHSVQ